MSGDGWKYYKMREGLFNMWNYFRTGPKGTEEWSGRDLRWLPSPGWPKEAPKRGEAGMTDMTEEEIDMLEALEKREVNI